MRVVIWLLIVTIIFCGCNSKTASNKTINLNRNDVINTNDNQWKTEITKRLFSEFCEFYGNIEQDDFIYVEEKNSRLIYNQQYNKTSYNRIMAADRAVALLGTYNKYLSDEELLFVESKKDEISNGFFADSHIYFGYTVSGLHVIAVCKGVTNNNLMYQSTCNKIRNLEDESELFNELINQNYYACDLFVEDLSNTRQTISNLTLELYSDYGYENPIKRACIFELSNSALSILNKYNREIAEENGVYKTRSWNLFVCNKPFDMVTVNVDSEKIELVDNIR